MPGLSGEVVTLPPLTPPTPVTPPTGSTSLDVDTVLPTVLLNYLSSLAKTAILSATNIGTSTISQIETSLEVIQNLASLAQYQIDGSPLNNLANGNTSAAFTVTNVGTSQFVRIVILLDKFQPLSGAKITISDNTTAYELSLTTTLSEKRLEFTDIPAAFVSSFTVENSTGTTFPAFSNFVMVIPL